MSVCIATSHAKCLRSSATSWVTSASKVLLRLDRSSTSNNTLPRLQAVSQTKKWNSSCLQSTYCQDLISMPSRSKLKLSACNLNSSSVTNETYRRRQRTVSNCCWSRRALLTKRCLTSSLKNASVPSSIVWRRTNKRPATSSTWANWLRFVTAASTTLLASTWLVITKI